MQYYQWHGMLWTVQDLFKRIEMNKNAKRRAICANKIKLSRMNDYTLPMIIGQLPHGSWCVTSLPPRTSYRKRPYWVRSRMNLTFLNCQPDIGQWDWDLSCWFLKNCCLWFKQVRASGLGSRFSNFTQNWTLDMALNGRWNFNLTNLELRKMS